ncbi:hypothetical protein AWC27_11590 [Mycobacterium szulgai]|uniref:YcaO domain-containing protein n=2 Tax=Mycobacterium szulgai TaxID=1787 RepID=A0A1X2DR37_MYCSZ|nr:hypothetical protein AWC27_11590 [Mycobacterium szulgai]
MTTMQSTAVQRGEREYSLADAAHRALSAISELGFTVRLDYYGGDPTVWRCQLFDGQQPAPGGSGYGKGAVDTARVGAHYEALEHFLTQQHRPETVQLRRCAELVESPLGTECYAALLAMQPDQLIACRIYHQLGGTNTLAVPLFLSNVLWADDAAAPLRAEVGDTTDYRSLIRYSSNNGSAIGGSLAEAAVHSLNEVIERDAVSLFLAHTFLATPPARPAFLAPETLPVDLRELLEAVQQRVSRKVWLVDITTDLGVPATLAYAAGLPGCSRRGYGASLSRHYSIYRALTELLEGELTDDRAEDRRRAVDWLADYPALQACAAFELPPPTTSSDYVPYADTEVPPSPAQHLSCLVDKLAERGYSVYLNEFHASANGVTTVHIHVPELERFNMIADGPSAVVPGRRALRALQG